MGVEEQKANVAGSDSGAVEKQTFASFGEESEEWVTGVKLSIIMSGAALVMFLALLDVAVVSTVSLRLTTSLGNLALMNKLLPGNTKDHQYAN
jgi:hypothetical protein